MESSTNSERQPLPVGGAIQPRSSGNVAPHIRRKSSTAKLVVERLVRTRERLWATGISATVAAIPALLVGSNWSVIVLRNRFRLDVWFQLSIHKLLHKLAQVVNTACRQEIGNIMVSSSYCYDRNKNLFALDNDVVV